jgi:hypothetical protein
MDDVYEWKTPITFYGRVVDEKMHPVANAEIDFSWTDTSKKGSSTDHANSDAAGKFSLQDRRGRFLQVRVHKEGYYPANKLNRLSFDYAGFWDIHYHVPDANSPVLFHLRGRGVGEALIEEEIRPTVPADGTAVRFDLLSGGHLSPNGQLEIAAITNAEAYPPRFFDWRATIKVPDGGLVEYDTEFPFEAPEDGYQPRVDFDMPQAAPNWQHGVDKTYFIRFGTPPKYGRIQIHMNGDSQKISITYAVNPSGSRNLEPSPPVPPAGR